MKLTCIGCSSPFEAAALRGYCDTCVAMFRERKQRIGRAQHPSPEVCLDGKFSTDKSPQTVHDWDRQEEVCGLCGSHDLHDGYGLGSGYGMGLYTFCSNCNSFLNFCEDLGE